MEQLSEQQLARKTVLSILFLVEVIWREQNVKKYSNNANLGLVVGGWQGVVSMITRCITKISAIHVRGLSTWFRTTSSWVVDIYLIIFSLPLSIYVLILPKQYFSSDYGTKTCAGYPGTIDHIQQDMDVSWLNYLICMLLKWSV